MLHYPQIARVDIVQFKRGRNVPACTVELEWTGSGEPKPLSHQVKISGAKKPAHFYLRYYPQAVGEFYLCAAIHACTSMRTCLNFHLIIILIIRYFSCQVSQKTRYCTLHLVNKQLLIVMIASVGIISFCVCVCMCVVCVCLSLCFY